MNKTDSYYMDNDITNLITYNDNDDNDNDDDNNTTANKLVNWIQKKLQKPQSSEDVFKHLTMAYNTTAWKIPTAALLSIILLYFNRAQIENHFWESLSKYKKWANSKHQEKSDLLHDIKTIKELAESQKSKYAVQTKLKETSTTNPPLVDDSLSIIVKTINEEGQPIAIMKNNNDEVPERLQEVWQIIGDTIAQHVDEINPVILPKSKGAVSFIVINVRDQSITTKELLRELKQKNFIPSDDYVTFETSLVNDKIHPELLISIVY